MRTEPHCIPCLLEQVQRTLERLEAPAELAEGVLRRCLARMAEADFSLTTPHHARALYGEVRRAVGGRDPFAAVKAEQNRLGLELVAGAAGALAGPEAFRVAVKLALAGNTLDLGVLHSLDPAEALQTLLAAEPTVDGVEALRGRVAGGGPVLYLADNAGEVALDRPLLQQLAAFGPVTVAVRGGPIINDATLDDARQVGLDRLDGVTLIDSGVDLPGTDLALAAEPLRRAWQGAETIVSKGQGNYETLCHLGDPRVCFIFMVKCAVVARQTGKPEGSSIVAFAGKLAAGA